MQTKSRCRDASIAGFLAILSSLAFADTAAEHVGKGYEDVQLHRYEEAVREFRAALALDPKLSRARYQLAVSLFALGRRSEAETEFNRVRIELHEAPEVLYFLGRIRLLQGDNTGAIELLRPIGPAAPFPDTPFYLGCAYMAAGDLKPAIQSLEDAARDAPRDYRIPYRLARAYALMGRTDDARKQFDRSSELRHSYNEAAEVSTACVRALQTKPVDEARHVCDRLADPNDPDKLTMLGILYGEHGAYQDAIRALQTAAQLDPDSFEIFHNLGLSYFRLQDYSQARPALERAVRLRPDFFGSNALLGAVLFTAGDDERAFEVLQHAHDLEPANTQTSDLFVRAALAVAQKRYLARDYQSCAEYLRKALAVHPGDPSLEKRLRDVTALAAKQSVSVPPR